MMNSKKGSTSSYIKLTSQKTTCKGLGQSTGRHVELCRNLIGPLPAQQLDLFVSETPEEEVNLSTSAHGDGADVIGLEYQVVYGVTVDQSEARVDLDAKNLAPFGAMFDSRQYNFGIYPSA